ncbi:MAG: Ig-like domain-containing protein, partial [Eubacterium sp.]|nr:Ig-like domain-containing protein [Eubacterium sp.]
YMSIKGKTGPDEMEEVLTQNTIKGKSLEKGVGIVNISEMLGTENAGAKLEINDYKGKEKTVQSGATAAATVYSLANIVVTPMLRSGEVNTDKDLQIFFTVDGKTPSFKEGIADEGTYYLTEKEKYGTESYSIELERFVNMANEKSQKLTFKVVCVSGSGMISKVTTLKLNVKPVWFNYDLYITDVPEGGYEVSSGGFIKFKAQLFKETQNTAKIAKPKNLRWEVLEGKDIASIGKKNGLLKTIKGKTGYVVIRCSCKEKGHSIYSEERAFYVGNHAPVKSFTISESEMELSCGLGGKQVSITSAVNNNGEDILFEDYVKYSWTSSNQNVAYPSSDYGTETTVFPRKNGKAIITCTAKDGSNTQARIKVTVRNKVISLEIVGQDSVAPGSRPVYKSEVHGALDVTRKKEISPPYDKRVAWFLNGDTGCTEIDGGKIKVDPKKGRVTVAANPTIKEFYICSIARDGSGISNSKLVRINEKKTTSIIVKAEDITTAMDDAYNIKLNKKGSIASMQLYTIDAESSNKIETWLTIRAGTDSKTTVSWRSSNEDVVSVSGSPWTATLKAKGAGTARITCTANDGTGKKASFIVKVIVPVSHLMLTNKDHEVYPGGTDGIPYLYAEKGKSTAIQPVFGESYGKPKKPKVKWSYKIVGYDDNNCIKALDEATIEKAEKAKLFSVKGSKVKINRNYDRLCTQNGLPDKIGLMITATSTDGTNVSDSILIIPVK